MLVGVAGMECGNEAQPTNSISNLKCNTTQPRISAMQSSSKVYVSDCHQTSQEVQRCLYQPHVQHIPQLYNWDCGLACVLMILRALGCCDCDFQQLKRLSQTTSVWTVDLAHLLARFGASVTFSTITVGINSDYADEWFYMEHLEHDEKRVRQLFQEAEQLDISVQERSLPLADLITAVTTGKQLAILLVDRRKIDSWQAAADIAWNYTTGVTSATSYTGHYILLVGYEPPAAAAAPDAADCLGSNNSSAANSGSTSSSHSAFLHHECSAQQNEAAGQRHQPKLSGECDSSSQQTQPTSSSVDRMQHDVEAAVDAACRQAGCFLVHDPARAHGPVRVPVNMVESARKTFGTDEDILLVDIKPLSSSKASTAADAADSHCVAADLKHSQLGTQAHHSKGLCALQQQYQPFVMNSDMQRSRSGQCSDHATCQEPTAKQNCVGITTGCRLWP